MFSRYNLINLGFNPWSKFWKRNQTITYLLSEKIGLKKTLFIHSTVWLNDLISNTKKEFSQPQINKWLAIIPQKVSRKITVFTPMSLPLKDKNKYIQSLNWQLNMAVIKKYINSPFVLLINDPQAEQRLVDELIKKSFFTIFDWSDDFVEFSKDKKEREICENKCRKYCEKSDVVLTVNDKLSLRAKEYNKNAYTVRNATNYFTFEADEQVLKKMNQRIRRIGPLVVGYVGWLNSLRLDTELIEYIADARKDINFVFMGPKSEEKPLGEKIPQMPNVHILPSVPYHKYAASLSSFDLCILPNRISAHTEGNDPIKIYDYLACGKPVISTFTAGADYFKDYLYLASNKIEFLECLNQALSEKSTSLFVKRQNIAKEHSWQKRITEVTEIIMPLLEAKMNRVLP